MVEIREKELIEYWLDRTKIREYFDTQNLLFRGRRYEKGEYLAAPDRYLKEILFLVEGVVQIYGIRDDGSISPVGQMNSPALLGDVEFCKQGISPFYAEARTTALCLTLSVEKYREQLDRDVRFLHLLLESYANKLSIFSTVDLPASTIEERVLLYMRNICPDGELRGIETALLGLHCSRRQLQRVLKKLCDNGRVEKTGKGKYRLVEMVSDRNSK